jgi:hypothetical protein
VGDKRYRETVDFPSLSTICAVAMRAIRTANCHRTFWNRSKGGNIRELPLNIAAPTGNECHRAIRSREPVFSLKRISKRSFLSEDNFNRLRKRIPRQTASDASRFVVSRKTKASGTAANCCRPDGDFFFNFKQKPRSAQRGSSWAWRPGCIPPR